MKKCIALLLAALLALSMFTTAFAATYKDKATVKAVQQALNDAGYNCGTPDGSAGKKTKAAIESYQADHGLEVTREIDDALLEALGLAEEQAEAEDEEDEENDHYAETHDAVVMAKLYNVYYLEMLVRCGIDVEGGEDIGQKDYMISSLDDRGLAVGLAADFYSPDPLENVKMSLEYDETARCDLTLSDETRQIGLTQYAALYSMLSVINAYFEGGRNDMASLLGAAPERDGVISLDDIPLVADGGFSSAELPYKITCVYISKGNKIVIGAQKGEYVSAAEDETATEEAVAAPAEAESVKAEQVNADLDLPADLVEATGGIPRSLDEISDKYKVNMERVIEDYLTVAPGEALKSFQESGSCTLAAPCGITVDPQDSGYIFAGVEDPYVEGGVSYERIDVEIKSAGDHIVMTGKENLPKDPMYLGLVSWCLAGSDYYDGMRVVYRAYEESVESDEPLESTFKDAAVPFSAQEGEAYWENYVRMEDYSIEAKPENGRYTYQLSYVERRGGNVEIIRIIQSEPIEGKNMFNPCYLWEGCYDRETGERIATSERELSGY